MKIKLQLTIAAIIWLSIYISAAHGQAVLTFGGGNGAPLRTTLERSVTYTITNTNCASSGGPTFIFDETGNPFGGGNIRNATGTIAFSINGAAAQPIIFEGSGNPLGDVSANDVYTFGSTTRTDVGTKIVLFAGTITTDVGIAAAPPAGGSFVTFITNPFGMRCSNSGVSAAPTAANVTISGRAATSNGRGIRGVRIQMTDAGGTVRTATTGALGYYRFMETAAGETYILSAKGKRYEFSQPTQVINATDDTDGVNFVANPNAY